MGDNFDSYVDVERPFVVWNVFASPEFSIRPINWCYPVAGCVSYRGYFSEADAQTFASSKRAEGLDVYVGGVSAYSTLGWFADPVLSTVIWRDDEQLAALLFHELAHRLVYIPGDTEFNESFATTMEREGLRRWLSARGVDSADVVLQSAFSTKAREDFVRLVESTVHSLQEVYGNAETDEVQKRHAKAEVFARMRRDYESLKQSWNGYDAYDAWMSRDLNNAQLGTVGTYNNWVPSLELILRENDDDLPRFYDAIAKLSDLSADERAHILSSKGR